MRSKFWKHCLGHLTYYGDTGWNISKNGDHWIVGHWSVYIAETCYKYQAQALVIRLENSIPKADILERFPGFGQNTDVNGADLVDWIRGQL